ncbi:MAG: hypothetical protein ACK5B6_03020 [Bacteroidia bacterium]|jgi:hypothetical protein
MKNVLPLAGILLFGLSANAQTINSNWSPVTGNQTRQLADALSVTFGSSGSGQIWDFSAALVDSTSIVSFVNPLGAPGSQFYVGSTIVENTTYTGSQSYTYFKADGAGFENLGVYSGLGLNYDIAIDSKKILEFPMSYLSSFTDEYTFQRFVNGSNDNNVVGAVAATVDASGTLILPGGISISDVLRIKYEESYSLIPAILPLPPPYPSGTKTTYLWLSPSYPGVILANWSSEIFDGLSLDPTFYFSIPSVLGINNHSSGLPIVKSTVNQNNISFSFGENSPYNRLTISNVSGQIICEKNIENAYSAELSTEAISSSLLFYTLFTPAGKSLSGKLFISK